MKKVLSYCLFGKRNRYWSPIPMVLIANSILFPDFYMRFHISPRAANHPLYPILADAAEKNPLIEIKVIKKSFEKTQATLWRMMPLWDESVKYVFCRDLDAIPVREEIRAVLTFLRTGFMIHGIRSYRLHTTPLMAGLCGFNCHRLRQEGLLPPSFKDYMKFAKSHTTECPNWQWGCDQETLKKFFYHNHKSKIYLMKKTLDTPMGSAPRVLDGFRAKQLPKTKYSEVDLSRMNRQILKISDRLHEFAGSPILKKKMLNILPRVLKIRHESVDMVRGIIEKHEKLKRYYLQMVKDGEKK